MARIQKRRDFIVTENGFEFLKRQRLFGVIAFDEVCFTDLFAQETPRVAASGSSAFQPEVRFHKVTQRLRPMGGQYRLRSARPTNRTALGLLEKY